MAQTNGTVSQGEQIDILLLGLGAIGSFYAFILSKSPEVRLSVVARGNYSVVKEKGFKITSYTHGEHTVRPHAVYREVSEIPPTKFDYIICTNKAIGQDKIAESLKPVVDEDKTSIVIFQNGVGNEDPFRAVFPSVTIMSGLAWVSAIQPTPGHIEHRASERTELGLFANANHAADLEQSRIEKLVGLFHQGGTPMTIEPNMQLLRWEKCVWNIAWNSLSTLTQLDTQQWLHSSDSALPLTKKLMTEAITVGRKVGIIGLEFDLVERLMERINAMSGVTTSMQTDAKYGRPLEVEIIFGTAVRKGRELGVEIPTLETIYVLLLGVDWRLRNIKDDPFVVRK